MLPGPPKVLICTPGNNSKYSLWEISSRPDDFEILILLNAEIPLLLSTSLILIMQSKENKIYNKIKILSFLIGFTLIIISETFLRFIGKDIFPNIKIMMIPFIIFLIIYLYFKLTLKTNIKYKKT